jgi:hypothetical protein
MIGSSGMKAKPTHDRWIKLLTTNISALSHAAFNFTPVLTLMAYGYWSQRSTGRQSPGCI